ncbi:hypothetical protein P5673_032342, partial [Acropora cervicornis]
ALVNHHEKINRITRKAKYVTFVANRVHRKRRTGLGTGSHVTHATHGPTLNVLNARNYRQTMSPTSVLVAKRHPSDSFLTKYISKSC